MNKFLTSGKNLYKQRIKSLKIKIVIFKSIFISLNLLIAILSSSTAIVAALVTSKIISTTGLPFGYLYLSSGVSAIVILLSSLLNFFLIKEKLTEAKKQIVELVGEKVKYDLQLSKAYKSIDKNYYFYLKVAAISGNEAAQQEVKHA